MSEELKQNEVIENPAPEGTELPAAQEPLALSVAVPTAVSMWNDVKLMNMSFKTARMLSMSAMVPSQYRNSPENCLVAIDIANRIGVSPLMVMQNLHIVQGKPGWSGSFCAAAVNGSRRFTELDYEFVGEPGQPSYGCYATAMRVRTGSKCKSQTITMKMAADEGWLNKSGSKWKTMPEQMLMYRAAAFFARVYCPDILLGYKTIEEIQDMHGTSVDGVTVVTLDEGGGKA